MNRKKSKIKYIQRKPVISSSISSIGYDSPSQTLELQFVEGAVYQYFDFPKLLYQKFLTADSKGRFLTDHVKGKYEFLKI